MVDHLRIQRPDHRARETEIADEERAGGDVDDGAGEGFVERGVGVAEALKAFARAEGLRKGRAEGEEGIFCGVVVVDCGVSVCGYPPQGLFVLYRQ